MLFPSKCHTPLPPKPGLLPKSATVRSSSFWRTFFRCTSISVVAGNAKTHFCMTVQTFGVGFEGVIAFISSSEAVDNVADDLSGTSIPASATTAAFPAEIMGRVACHCPSLRATPRQTDSEVRASEVLTFPLMNLYRRPFWKRASS